MGKSGPDGNRPPDPERMFRYLNASSPGIINENLAKYQKSMGRFQELYGRGVGNQTVSSGSGQGYGYRNPNTGKSFHMPKYTGGVQGPPVNQSNPSGQSGFWGWIIDAMMRDARKKHKPKKYDAPDVENLKGVD